MEFAHCLPIPSTPVSQVIIDVPTVYTTSNGTYMAFRSGGLICPAGSPAGADLMSIRCCPSPRRIYSTSPKFMSTAQIHCSGHSPHHCSPHTVSH